MIALVLVVGVAVALCVAGWVSLVRGALGPAAVTTTTTGPAAATVRADDVVAEPVSA